MVGVLGHQGIPLKGQLCIRVWKERERKKKEGNREESQRQTERGVGSNRKQEGFIMEAEKTATDSKHSLALQDITPHINV